MDINKILQHPAINRAEIARRLYPGIDSHSATTRLNMKIAGAQGRSLSEEEQNRIFEIWTNIKEEIHQPTVQKVSLNRDTDGKITAVPDPKGNYTMGIDPY